MSTNGPTLHRVALPTSGRWPRAGKIRLGTWTKDEAKSVELGRDVGTPAKADHFIVVEDESGITSAEAAAAFHRAYGDEPRTLRFMLPGDTPDDCFEGAWRLYGTNKLKRRCDGESCSERTKTDGWRDTACVCKADGISPDDKQHHCALTYTLSLILPDVAMPGIWQVDTGSEISARNVADFLEMLSALRRGESLRFLEGDLNLVEQKVQPRGAVKTFPVYVLLPQPRGVTVSQLLSGQIPDLLDQHGRGELPPAAADEAPEPTLAPQGFSEDPAPDVDAARPAGAAADVVEPETSLLGQVKAMVAHPDGKARLKRQSVTWTVEDPDTGEPVGVPQTQRGIAAYLDEFYPGRSLEEILVELEAGTPEELPL